MYLLINSKISSNFWQNFTGRFYLCPARAFRRSTVQQICSLACGQLKTVNGISQLSRRKQIAYTTTFTVSIGYEPSLQRHYPGPSHGKNSNLPFHRQTSMRSLPGGGQWQCRLPLYITLNMLILVWPPPTAATGHSLTMQGAAGAASTAVKPC